MIKKNPTELEYREVILSGIGRVMVPAHLSDAAILAELGETENPQLSQKTKEENG